MVRAGTHVLTARATDSTGAQNTSAPVTVTVLSPQTEPILFSDGANTWLGIRHYRLPALTNRTQLVQASHDLLAWQPIATTPVITPIGIVDRLETRDVLAIQGLGRRFLRTTTQRTTP